MLLGTEVTDSLTEIDMKFLVENHGLPAPKDKNDQHFKKDEKKKIVVGSVVLGDAIKSAMKSKLKYEKPQGVLPYNLPADRGLDKRTLQKIEECPDNLYGKIKAGMLSTRFDVLLFEIVSFMFTIMFFYILPFTVINLPLIVNGMKHALQFIIPDMDVHNSAK
jgi:hypothetical protein